MLIIINRNHHFNILFLVTFSFPAARYFDSEGLDTPLGHPAADRNDPRFGSGQSSSQDVTDDVFDILNIDQGNKYRVAHVYMTFGQFLDHDIAYILHASGPETDCRAR